MLVCYEQQHEDLQSKYDDQVRKCCDLSNKLDSTEVSYRSAGSFLLPSYSVIHVFLSRKHKTTQKNLNKTAKLLANAEEELKKCRYSLKEKDFIISEQKKAGMHDFKFPTPYFFAFDFLS